MTPAPNFATYQPPGVYVSETPTAPTAVAGFGPGLLALVGPSLGFQTHTEAVTLTGTTAVTLAKQGIDTSSLSVVGIDGTVFTSGGDWTATSVEGGGDTGTTQDNNTTLARTNPTDIASGQQVIVTYQYEDTLFYEPRRLRSYDQVRGIYGEMLDASGAIQSPLSMAAKLAFDNGASEVIVCAAVGDGETTREDLSDALNKISANQDVNVVCPVTAGIEEGDAAEVLTDLANHCNSASDDSYYRTGIVGFDSSVTSEPDDLAQAIEAKRLILAWPYDLLRYNSVTDAHEPVGGYYLAAALGGILVANDPQIALTNKTVRGFSGIASTTLQSMTPSLMNQYGQSGVTVVHIGRDRRMTVRHGLTTDVSDIHTREASIVRAKDAMFSLFEQTFLRSNIIGQPLNDETLAQIKGLATGAAEQCVDIGLITGYTGLGVMQSSVDPTVVQVSIEYGPPYTTNYISIVFAINTTTGQVNETDLATAA